MSYLVQSKLSAPARGVVSGKADMQWQWQVVTFSIIIHTPFPFHCPGFMAPHIIEFSLPRWYQHWDGGTWRTWPDKSETYGRPHICGGAGGLWQLLEGSLTMFTGYRYSNMNIMRGLFQDLATSTTGNIPDFVSSPNAWTFHPSGPDVDHPWRKKTTFTSFIRYLLQPSWQSFTSKCTEKRMAEQPYEYWPHRQGGQGAPLTGTSQA